MSITVEVTYEGGVLKPVKPLPFREHEKLRVTVEPEVSLASTTSGLLGWMGDAETVERIALDPEFSVEESP